MTDEVSRETPPPPAVAAEVFSHRLPLAESYAELLAGPGVVRGLIGPREVPRLWDRHLLNCAVAAEAIHTGESVVDVGSGAGLPGLVWAIARPDLQITLLEPLLRRTVFLEEAVAELGLTDQVTVLRGRAEELAFPGKPRFDVVTSRAVAPLGRLLQWCAPLARTGGRMVALKGSSAHEEIAAHSADIAKVSRTQATVATYGGAVLDRPTTTIEITLDRPVRASSQGRGRKR